MGEEGYMRRNLKGGVHNVVRRYHRFRLNRALGKTADGLGLAPDVKREFIERAWSKINEIGTAGGEGANGPNRDEQGLARSGR